MQPSLLAERHGNGLKYFTGCFSAISAYLGDLTMEQAEPRLGGLGYPHWFRQRVLDAFFRGAGSVDERAAAAAAQFGVDIRSLRRWRARLAATGSSARAKHSGGPAPLLTPEDDILLVLYSCEHLFCVQYGAVCSLELRASSQRLAFGWNCSAIVRGAFSDARFALSAAQMRMLIYTSRMPLHFL